MVGGSEVYVRALIEALRKQPNVRLRLFCNYLAAQTFHEQPNLDVLSVSARRYNELNRLIDESFTLVRLLRRYPIDVLFSPASIAAPFLPSRVPQVVTVHDLQHATFPSNFSRRERLGRSILFKASVTRCRRVIAISETTRSDILRQMRVSEKKVVTVYEGAPTSTRASESQIQSVLTRHGLKKPFFVYPAMVAPHKNHRMLLRAFGRFASSTNQSHDLVLTGKKTAYTDETLRYAAGLGLGGLVHYLGFIPEEDLAALVSSATALLYPSRFEGFGLPVLEAFRYGTPAVVSTAPAVSEVAGAAALLVDFDDESAWTEAMVLICSDVEVRENLVRQGIARSSSFSWSLAAEQTLRVLRAASAGRSTPADLETATEASEPPAASET